MGKLEITNLERHVAPETTMFPQEADVIVRIIIELIKNDGGVDKGTFILDGQKNGREAKCLVRFNLKNGVSTHTFKRIHEKTSEQLAEESIDYAIAYPRPESRHVRLELMGDKKMKSGVWQDGEHKVLVLNTTAGRFLCSWFANYKDGVGREKSTQPLMTVSEAIAQMSKEDTILQESNDTIWFGRSQNQPELIELRQWVAELFERCTLSELRAWKKWHEPASKSGKLKLFFK
ncbi:MAG: hypothetical protein LBK50_02690 [Candidatus Nomurabacteria bacterium]|jgi:hypothetical protein|nr:hypothetical protein [Candidatus Nomurabacteria bacterium]